MKLEDLAAHQTAMAGALITAMAALAALVARQPGVDGDAFGHALIQTYRQLAKNAQLPAGRAALEHLEQATRQALGRST